MKNDPKWKMAPTNLAEATTAISGKRCPICNSDMLVPFIRPPIPNWKVHCNHCSTEIVIAVMLNREAWREIEKPAFFFTAEKNQVEFLFSLSEDTSMDFKFP